MLSLETMLLRLVVAIILGGIIGLEREFAGKAAGLRTDIMVASGSAIFSMISFAIPFIAGVSGEALQNTLPDRVLANIVVGVGFLGAGIIVKQGTHVRGLTTAATVWFTAAIGALVGIGLLRFATIATVLLTFLLVVLKQIDIYKLLGKQRHFEDEGDSQ